MRTALDIDAAIERMVSYIRTENIPEPLLIGIHTGGVLVAEVLHRKTGITEPLGTLDISFYRDDFGRVGLNPQVRASHLPVSVEDRNIFLVDDVLYTGRTIRAALNEIFSYGRPARVILGVLVKRTGRELPIQPDFTGMELELAPDQQARITIEASSLAINIAEIPG